MLAVPLVVVSACFWPGHMNADTLAQLAQVATGRYNNQHDPLLLALWHPLWTIGVGTGWMLMAQVAAVLAGGYLVLRALFAPVAAAVGSGLIALSPPVFGTLGLVGRDVWFTGALLLAFGAAIRASKSVGAQRVTWLAAGVAAAWVALAARQNAAFAVVVVAAALVAVTPIATPVRVRRRAAGRVAYWAVAGVVVTLALMATQRALSAAVGVQDVHPEQYTFIYDMGALSKAENRNLLPADVLPDRSMEPIERYWYVDTVTTLLYLPGSPIHTPLPEQAADDLSSAWRSEVLDHPVEYLGERGRLWLREASITRKPWWIYHPRIDANTWGLHIRFPDLNAAAKRYVEAFADKSLNGGIVHTVVIYLLIALAGAVAFLRRGHLPTLVIAGALCLSALTYQIGLFFGATGVQYRFEFPVVVTGLLALCLLGNRALSRLRRRRA